MNIYITTFYNVRNLHPNDIPVSTAAWDPRWFHEGKGPDYIFRDKRGVINGLRIEELNPNQCHASGCPCNVKDPTKCEFIKSYKEGLRKNDFTEVLTKLYNLVTQAQPSYEDYKLNVVLLVYEAESNPCSERQSIIEYFKENGVEIKEWHK